SIGYRSFFGTPIVGSPFTFDLSVFGLLFFFVPFALFTLVFFRHGRTCIVGMLSGFFGGLMIALLALKAGWIDCRGWDLVSIMTGKNLLIKGSRKSNRTSLAEPDRDSTVVADQLSVAQSNSSRETLVRKFTAALSSRNSGAARDTYQKLRERFPVWKADGPELLQFAEHLIDDGGHEEAVPLLTDYLARFQTSKTTVVRLKLAQILIDPLQRPRRALAILEDLPPGDLGNPKYNTLRDSLIKRADKLIEDGVMEVRQDA
ncbi:MAG: hypothetical protein NT069_25270, partial [Planctomycetota bacterium]|nr:hypothetical protein [Planctomycetota bacterium]